MLTETDVELADGRVLHAYDTGPTGRPDELVVVWHHGTPGTGEPPLPLLPATTARGIRWVSHDRPGYGGSTRRPGRDVASAAGDVAAVADALGVGRFAVLGHSGGGPHALACAALLPDRVIAAVSGSALAPPEALRDARGAAPGEAPDDPWFAGMAPAGTAELRAAVAGHDALHRHLTGTPFDPTQFTPADHAVLSGPWGWLGSVAGQGTAGGVDGAVDDDLAYVAPWGFDPAATRVPVLVLHGADDLISPAAHGEWLAGRVPGAELWLRPGEGHVSVLGDAPAALDWLRGRAAGS